MLSRVDRIIEHCTAAARLIRDTQVQFDVGDLHWLCTEAIRVLRDDPILLRLQAPLVICGDVHGQFYDLLSFMKTGGIPPATNYLFLGDYVDRGKNSIEVMAYLLALKVKYPKNLWLLRGNHETRDISRQYGFFEECTLRYHQSLWDKFNDVFLWLPIVAVISGRIFCVHGGISPELTSLNQIAQLRRPLDIPAHGLLSDLLWSDPSLESDEWRESARGTSYTYGESAVDDFIRANDFDLICRAHQVVKNGYEFPFYPNRSVLTVFSAPGYCEGFPNKGAVLKVGEKLQCDFSVIEPLPTSAL
jgi:serine/threonine-protein phosphatase PP1 catalytic subunit